MKKIFLLVGLVSAILANASAFLFSNPFENYDGYEAWLHYTPVQNQELLEDYKQAFLRISLPEEDATIKVLKAEIERALPLLLGENPVFTHDDTDRVGIRFALKKDLSTASTASLTQELGGEGFTIYKVGAQWMVVAESSKGLLYGMFHWIKSLRLEQPLSNMDITSTPKVQYRMTNHWDNLNRRVERGYAGLSIWEWETLPEYSHPRYADYARLLASLGLNSVILNNVNADPRILNNEFLNKIRTIAQALHPYGIDVFLSINYQSPMRIGGLETADPLDAQVEEWWAQKATQIYDLIPNFGGFLVKADSEGQPGPFAYGRDHAVGANVLARAVKPFGGVVIWRAFVYSPEQEDRFREAFDEFVPLDGKFESNVILQTKNGPIDFQPREPFSPLFGAMENTNTMLELQITQEYFGFSNHLAYQGTLFEEVLRADTYAKGTGSTVADVITAKVFDYEFTGMAGVLNIGTDRNWTRHPFVQSSWYAFGALAWNPYRNSQEIAEEWVRLTFGQEQQLVATITHMMMISREAGVNYRMPLGLTHLYAQGHHYGPAPWTADLPRPDWTAVYYHKADKNGIGFDRTSTGSNAIEQYNEPLKSQFATPEETPEELLLWFHHLPWNYTMKSGKTLWDELVLHYYKGVDQVQEMQVLWNELEGRVDDERFQQVRALLAIQHKDAKRWRDSCVLYFQSFSQLPLPDGLETPEHDLEYYKSLEKTLFIPDVWYGN